MAQTVFNHVGGKPPFFDGTSFDYWKRKMKMYLGSINDNVWDVVENEFIIIDTPNRRRWPPPRRHAARHCAAMATAERAVSSI